MPRVRKSVFFPVIKLSSPFVLHELEPKMFHSPPFYLSLSLSLSRFFEREGRECLTKFDAAEFLSGTFDNKIIGDDTLQ